MYSLAEIGFFILYFGSIMIASIIVLLLIQGLMYRITGFSIYRFINKKLDKIFR